MNKNNKIFTTLIALAIGFIIFTNSNCNISCNPPATGSGAGVGINHFNIEQHQQIISHVDENSFCGNQFIL